MEKRRASLWVETSLLLTVFFFGTNFVAVKHVVESVPPILFAAVRFTLAGMLLWFLLRLVEPETRLRRENFLPVLGPHGVPRREKEERREGEKGPAHPEQHAHVALRW